MKQLKVLAIFYIALLGIVGCQANRPEYPAVEVNLDGNGKFPEFLVGRWKANESNWEFIFEPDGTISSSVIDLGRVKMIPGKTTRLKTRSRGKAEYQPGQWIVNYSPETRDLTVEVVITYFYQNLGKYAAEGDSVDILAGHVSEDGKIWWVDWFSSGKLIALLDKPKKLHDISEPMFRKSLFFEKVE